VQSWPLKQRDWRRITVDNAGNIADPEGVARRLVDENGHAIEHRDHAAALAAIKTALSRLFLKTPLKSAPEIGGNAGLGSTGGPWLELLQMAEQSLGQRICPRQVGTGLHAGNNQPGRSSIDAV
jgi:hypothetical protein